jgi:protein-disulfide isomerase
MEIEERGRPRLVGLIVLGIVLLVLGTSVVGIALQEPDDDPIEITGAGTVQRLLGGIEQDGAVLGDSDAPVTVEVFNDLQCPECADYQLDVITPLIEGPVRAGDVKLVFHHFSLTQRQTNLSSYAAVAAGEQGRQWQYIQLFYINQDEARDQGVTDELLERIASAVLEFDQGQWQEDRESDEVSEAVVADADLAAQRRLPADPAVVVTGPLQTRELVEAPSLVEIEAAIEEVDG